MDAKNNIFRAQLAGIAVKHLNDVAEASKNLALNAQAKLMEKALAELDGVRAWLDDPSKLLGSPATKHGELAEIFEVQVRNARSIIDGLAATATFEGTSRTGAVDYFIDGQAFQSKFCKEIPDGLQAFVKHMEKYPEVTRTGGLMFPADKYELVLKVINSKPEPGKEDSTRIAIVKWVTQIEEIAGRKFEEAVRPSISTYSEVQLGVADQTVDSHEFDIEDRNSEHVERIEMEHGPSWAGAAQAAALAGTVSGVITTGMAIYNKTKEGKSLFRGEFTTEDWKDVGWAGTKGFGAGAVSGGAIYGLTNYAGMAAPFAASVVSAAKGLSTLTSEYMAGNIELSEYFDLGMCICAEAAVVGVATAAGQTLIPIPIIGGVIGSISGKMMLQLAHGLDTWHLAALQEEMASFNASLDKTYQRVVNEITAEFDKLGMLTEAAFDFELNHRLTLSTSVDLAVAYGVQEVKILRSVSDVDAFMLR
ncbi:hypothetical protein JQR84_24500 (plasmid) [Pseudomonas luteola]|uniref:hypothetical protein n=1 Tax=Pseudomonas TaxID=286 RepID=UPI003DA1671D